MTGTQAQATQTLPPIISNQAPQGNSLPWVQTLAGLFGGLMNARQQQMANPRYGFNIMPVLAGGLQGLFSGISADQTRNETLRQEQRSYQNAVVQTATATGRTPQEVISSWGGYSPTEYSQDAANSYNTGHGNVTAAQELGMQNPSSYFGMNPSLANTLLGKAQQMYQDQATSAGLPQAQAAGVYDAGAEGTGNQLHYASPPSAAAMYGPISAAMKGMPVVDPRTGKQIFPKMGIAPMSAGGAPMAMPVTGPIPVSPQALQPNTPYRVYSNGPNSLLAGELDNTDSPQMPAAPPHTGVSLRDLALSSPDPRYTIAQYGQSADATNGRNTNQVSVWNNAQNNYHADQRAIVEANKPSIAGIIQNGTPQQRQALNDYASASGSRLASMLGIDKPPTRSEIGQAATAITKACDNSRAEGLAATKLAVQTGSMDENTAVNQFDATDEGQQNPITPQERATMFGPSPDASVNSGSGSVVTMPQSGATASIQSMLGLPNLNTLQQQQPRYSGVSQNNAQKRARENNGEARISRVRF